MVPLIGSLLGLATQGVALGINQAQRANSRNIPVANSAASRAELARRLNAQQQQGGFNPMLAQRNAAEAQTNASLRFSAQDMQARQQANAQRAQMEREDANALQQGLVGLGAGLAGGAAQLATSGLGDKTPGLGGMVGGAQGKADTLAKQNALDPGQNFGRLGQLPQSGPGQSPVGGSALTQLLGGLPAPTRAQDLSLVGGAQPAQQPSLEQQGLALPQEQGQPAAFTSGASLQPTGPAGQPMSEQELFELEKQRVLNSYLRNLQ